MVAISSCLAGIPCRYDGSSCRNEKLLESIGGGYMCLCPETLAGFGIPRRPCEISGGSGEDVLAGKAKIIDADGRDITGQLLAGAEKALRLCLENGVTRAFLRTRSPSCGCGAIYDGTFSSTLKPGNGVFAALLIQNGIEVIEVK
jgi:uncharacterized protein YbbK (DUF523 family)